MSYKPPYPQRRCTCGRALPESQAARIGWTFVDPCWFVCPECRYGPDFISNRLTMSNEEFNAWMQSVPVPL